MISNFLIIGKYSSEHLSSEFTEMYLFLQVWWLKGSKSPSNFAVPTMTHLFQKMLWPFYNFLFRMKFRTISSSSLPLSLLQGQWNFDGRCIELQITLGRIATEYLKYWSLIVVCSPFTQCAFMVCICKETCLLHSLVYGKIIDFLCWSYIELLYWTLCLKKYLLFPPDV